MEGRLSWAILGGVAALLGPGLCRADSVNAEWYSTTRARSMGNVGIASSDDPTTSAFFNPAALARIKKASVEAFNPQLELGGGIFTDAGTLADYPKVASFSKSMPLLRANPGKPISAGFGVFPNVSAQNFSFGILFDVDGSSYFDLNKNGYFYHSRRILMPTLGLSAAGLGGRFKIGASLRGVQLNETNLTTPGAGTSAIPQYTNARQGFGVGVDGGILMTMPWAGLPTIGLVARNAGGTSFPNEPIIPLGGAPTDRHEIVPMTYDAGIAFTPKAQKSQVTFAVDYRDVLNHTHAAIARHGNVGLEYAANKMFFFRAGFSQGYWTAGFGLDSKLGSLDIGTYEEELDPTAYHGQGDRRYSMRLLRRF